jgi:hypothetical protein
LKKANRTIARARDVVKPTNGIVEAGPLLGGDQHPRDIGNRGLLLLVRRTRSLSPNDEFRGIAERNARLRPRLVHFQSVAST